MGKSRPEGGVYNAVCGAAAPLENFFATSRFFNVGRAALIPANPTCPQRPEMRFTRYIDNALSLVYLKTDD